MISSSSTFFSCLQLISGLSQLFSSSIVVSNILLRFFFFFFFCLGLLISSSSTFYLVGVADCISGEARSGRPLAGPLLFNQIYRS
jgi:hypothetical protein